MFEIIIIEKPNPKPVTALGKDEENPLPLANIERFKRVVDDLDVNAVVNAIIPALAPPPAPPPSPPRRAPRKDKGLPRPPKPARNLDLE